VYRNATRQQPLDPLVPEVAAIIGPDDEAVAGRVPPPVMEDAVGLAADEGDDLLGEPLVGDEGHDRAECIQPRVGLLGLAAPPAGAGRDDDRPAEHPRQP
jgi:hypothetical protein